MASGLSDAFNCIEIGLLVLLKSLSTSEEKEFQSIGNLFNCMSEPKLGIIAQSIVKCEGAISVGAVPEVAPTRWRRSKMFML